MKRTFATLALFLLAVAGPISAQEDCKSTVTSGTLQATGTFVLTIDGPVGDPPDLNSVWPSVSACTRGATSATATGCDDLTLHGTLLSQETGVSLEWKYDLPDENDALVEADKCAGAELSDCDAVCWTSSATESPLVAGPLANLSSIGTQRILVCVDETGAGAEVADDDFASTSVFVREQTLVGTITRDPTEGEGTPGTPLSVDVTLNWSGTCPTGSGVDVTTTDCGFEGTESLGFAAGSPGDLDGTAEFLGACEYQTAGLKTITATLENCGSAPDTVITTTVNVTTPPADDVPQILDANYSTTSCDPAGGATCDAITFTGHCVAGTCDDVPVAWRLDSDNDCTDLVNCSDPCYDFPLGATPDVLAVPTPDAMFAVAGDILSRVCLEDTNGDDAPTVAMPAVHVVAVPPTFFATLTATPPSGVAPHSVGVQIDMDGTCPDLGFPPGVTVSNTDCGAGGVANAAFNTGVVGSTDNPITFAAGACSYAAATSATVSADVTCGVTTRTVTAAVNVTAQPPTTLTQTIVPLDANGTPMSSCDEPCTVAKLAVYLDGTWNDAAGTQNVTQTFCQMDGAGGFDLVEGPLYGSVPTCYASGSSGDEAECSSTVPLYPRRYPRADGFSWDYATDGDKAIRCDTTVGGVEVKTTVHLTVNNVGDPALGHLTVDHSSLSWPDLIAGSYTAQTGTFTFGSSNANAVNFTTTANDLTPDLDGDTDADFSCTNNFGTTGTATATQTCTLTTGLPPGSYQHVRTTCNDAVAGECLTQTISVTVCPTTGCGGGGPLAGAEKRCTDLGVVNRPYPGTRDSGCICSEPLQSPYVNGGTAITASLGGDQKDPDDSPNATECVGESAFGGAISKLWQGDPAIQVAAATAQPLPPLYSTAKITQVLHATRQWQVNDDLDIDELPNTTLCQRFYSRWTRHDPTYGNCNNGWGDNHGFRLTEMTSGYDGGTHTGAGTMQITSFCSGSAYHTTINGTSGRDPSWGDPRFTTRMEPTAFGFGRVSIDSPNFPTMEWGSCIDNFCRVEMCLDFRSDGHLRMRARIATLPASNPGGAFSSPWPERLETMINAWSPTAQTRLWSDPSHIYYPYTADNGDAHNGGVAPDRYALFAMKARSKPASTCDSSNPDACFWIGPACEVEGGCP